MNTVPGYQCLSCPYGYTGENTDALAHDVHARRYTCEEDGVGEVLDALPQQDCTDINECLVNNGNCDPNAFCYNREVNIHATISLKHLGASVV